MPIEITMPVVQVGVQDVATPEGQAVRVIRFEDAQSGIAVVVPMDIMAATRIGNALLGKALVTPPPGLPGGQRFDA
jgi:hypothetical protein